LVQGLPNSPNVEFSQSKEGMEISFKELSSMEQNVYTHGGESSMDDFEEEKSLGTIKEENIETSS
jgi:hypothetical protein